MKGFIKTDLRKFNPEVFEFFSRQWLLLTAGDMQTGDFNSMTVSWGFLGTMWNRPCVTLVVRPQRKTLEFLQKYDTFTCCAFPEEYREDLAFLGKVSGNEDPAKITRTSLTPTMAADADAPAFAQASLVLEGKVKLITPTAGKNFLDKKLVKEFYPDDDYHQILIGEIIAIYRKEE